MKRTFVCVAALLGFGLLIGGNQAGDDKPKFTISEVMKKAFAKKDYKSMEKDQLVELMTALSKNKPPKGDAESWKKKTTALVDAAKTGGAEAVGKAVNCGACHGEHKGKKAA
jgi:hypothetical protein